MGGASHRFLPARARRLLALGTVAVAAACGGNDGVAGIVGGPVPPGTDVPAGPATLPATTAPPTMADPSTQPSSVPIAPGASAPTATTAPAPTPVPPTAGPAPVGLRLGGNDLGVTTVGAPIRDAVAAVARVLGPPAAYPAPDTACIGAQEEASWGSFRLGASGGRVSGWLSTSTSLATPAGVTVGTTLAALRQAYGDRLEVRPPAPESDAVFLVGGTGLAGTLTGTSPSGSVKSFFNGTCEAQ